MSTQAASPAESTQPFLELRDLHKRFGSNRVLRGVDLTIEPGEIFTILGGSGSGKSVMLKHMVGLLRPDRGQIRVEGRDVTGLSERRWVSVRTQVGYVFQGAALFDSLSAYENVAYSLREHMRDWPEDRIRDRVSACLEAVGLAGVERRMPAELSGGMRKRLGVARAIALEPKAILYDEPTTGLDPANARRIGQMICQLRQRLHVTSVVVTHEMDLCFAISDRIVLLKDGRIVAAGSPEEIRSSAQSEVREFLEGGYDSARDFVNPDHA
jgi:phospholipid/cholesterol/gamma-HCH transport system ATP-binding protein